MQPSTNSLLSRISRSLASAASSFFFNDTATTEIYTLSLHDALPIYGGSVISAYRSGGTDAVLDQLHTTGLGRRGPAPVHLRRPLLGGDERPHRGRRAGASARLVVRPVLPYGPPTGARHLRGAAAAPCRARRPARRQGHDAGPESQRVEGLARPAEPRVRRAAGGDADRGRLLDRAGLARRASRRAAARLVAQRPLPV